MTDVFPVPTPFGDHWPHPISGTVCPCRVCALERRVDAVEEALGPEPPDPFERLAAGFADYRVGARKATTAAIKRRQQREGDLF